MDDLRPTTIRREEENLAVVLNSISYGLLTTDAARRITMMNPVAETLTGWPLSEALGRPIEEVFLVIDQETLQPVAIPVDDAFAAGPVHNSGNHTLLVSR